MPDKKAFDLGDYVEVKDRIKLFYELFGKGALVTETVEILTAPDGKQRVMVRSLAYRTPDDPHPGVGHSWMELPGTTPYTRGSEVENAETSSWGRAIGALGILIDRSIATTNEIESKAGTPEPTPPREGSLIGVVEAAKAPHDLELRQTPTGHAIGFSLKEGRQIVRVIAEGQLAEQIGAFLEAVQGKRATVYGIMSDDSWTMNAGTAKERVVPYTRLAASSLNTEDGLILPVEEAADTASRLVPEAAGEMPEVPTAQPSEPHSVCGAKGPDSIPGGAVCNQDRGHAAPPIDRPGYSGKHRELASDGRVLASW